MEKSSYPSWAEWLAGLPVPPADLRPADANPLATTRRKSPTTTWSMPSQVRRHSVADVKTNLFPLAGCPRAASLGRTRHGNRDQAGKPNCSYPALIGMALNDSKCGSLPVSAIYKFLEGEFPYFKDATKAGKIAWKSSIRHTLSQGQYFRKAEKPGMKGKRGFLYEIIPEKRAALERELQKYTGIMEEDRKIATSQKPASPLPVMNVPHDGMSLVDQAAHATTTVHPLPHSPKTQQWNLMNRDTFQYQSTAKHPVINISYKAEQPQVHNGNARSDGKDPEQSTTHPVAPPLLKLPQLPGMKRPSMEPEMFIFPEPGTYSRIDVPGAEYTIPLVQAQPRLPYLRPPPFKLQPPPVGKRKHWKCVEDSNVPHSEGGANLLRQEAPAVKEMPKDTTVVPFTARPWNVPNSEEFEFSDGSLSDSVFLSPQTLIGPHTPSEGSPGVWIESSSNKSPAISAAGSPPLDLTSGSNAGGKTAEELVNEIPADFLEKYGIDHKFIQENLPNVEPLFDSDVFRETVMGEETPLFNTWQLPATTQALNLCPSVAEVRDADRALYNLRNFVVQYFANDSNCESILTNLGNIQTKLDSLQDTRQRSQEAVRSMAQSPASDDPEFNTIQLHRSLEHMQQLDYEIISWWDNYVNTPRSPPTQPGAPPVQPVSECAITSTSTVPGQPQSPQLELPTPGKHLGTSTPPTSTVADAEFEYANRNTELDECLEILLQGEGNTLLQQNAPATTPANTPTTSLFQQSSLPTSTVELECANRNTELEECLEILLQGENDTPLQQNAPATTSLLQQSSLPTSTVTVAEFQYANRNTELDECLEMLLQVENNTPLQQTTTATTSLLQQSSRKRPREDDGTEQPPENSLGSSPKRIKTEPPDMQPPTLSHTDESASSQAQQAFPAQGMNTLASVYIPPEIAATFDLEEELRFNCCPLVLEMGQE